MEKKAIHVIPSNGKWAVKTAGATRAARICGTLAEAVLVGQGIARSKRTEMIVHREDGTIRSKDSYVNDPFHPRDRNHPFPHHRQTT